MGTFTLTSDNVVHVSTYFTYMAPMYVYIRTQYLYTIPVHNICTLYLYAISVHNSQGVYTHNRYLLNLIQYEYRC